MISCMLTFQESQNFFLLQEKHCILKEAIKYGQNFQTRKGVTKGSNTKINSFTSSLRRKCIIWRACSFKIKEALRSTQGCNQKCFTAGLD